MQLPSVVLEVTVLKRLRIQQKGAASIAAKLPGIQAKSGSFFRQDSGTCGGALLRSSSNAPLPAQQKLY